jgi:TetR/AcrR family transcriptional repressor of nem operon
MGRLTGVGRTGYAQGFARHLDRLASALRLSDEPERNRDQVTHLMSSLVGALIFARAMDDPARSDALLASSRRMLRQEFCGERRNLKPET